MRPAKVFSIIQLSNSRAGSVFLTIYGITDIMTDKVSVLGADNLPQAVWSGCTNENEES